MSYSSVRKTEEHEPLSKALELGRLSGRGELGPALQAHVRLGEGLRMPAPMTVVPHISGLAYANLPGRKPREGERGWNGVDYGDLNAAAEVWDWS